MHYFTAIAGFLKKILGNGELNPGPPRAVPNRTWQAEILATKLLPTFVKKSLNIYIIYS